MQPNPDAPLSWLWQDLVSNAVWAILILILGVVIAVVRKKRSEWLSPALYGLIGAVLFGILIYAPAFHARWPLATPLILVGGLLLAAGVHLTSVFLEKRKSSSSGTLDTDSAVSVPISPTETRLKLQFNVGNPLPIAVEYLNIYRWYKLHLDEVVLGPASTELSRRQILTTIFILFDSPIIIRQWRIDSGGAKLPSFEVKDQSDRHGVIVFQGSLQGLILDIEAIHS